MVQHGRRREHRAARRLTMPLAVVGLGLAQLGVVSAGSLAATAVAAPAVTSTDGGSSSTTSDGGKSGDSVPCAKTVKACARLSTQEMWITDGAGKLLRGPMRMNHGDKDNPTPPGTYSVQRKSRYHVSQEQGSKMPYAVFFDGNGRAFHQGDPSRQSVGCIRLAQDDARFVFENLDVGDSVQIVK